MSFKLLDPNKEAITISKKKNFKIAVFSDAHVGGRTGYLPSGCKHERGEDQVQTTDQEKMEKKLLADLDTRGEIDIVIFLGDMVEGKNSKAGGLDVGNVNTDCQVDWGVIFFQTIIDRLNPKIVMGLNGSDYHVETSLDQRLIYRTSLIPTNKKIDFYFGYPSLKFKLGDKKWWLCHQAVEGASKAGTLERYWKQIHNKLYGREEVPTVIGYGHIHQAQNPFQLKNGINPVYGFTAPCFKLPDTYCSKGPMGTHWDIGYLLIEQDGFELSGKYVNTYSYWLEK